MTKDVWINILCQLNTAGGIGGKNLIPGGSTYSGGGTYTLAISANTSYVITWGANDTSAAVGGDTYPSTGAGTSTTFYSGSDTTIVFSGTGGSTVTVELKRAGPNNIPLVSGMTLTPQTSGTQVLVAWNLGPSTITVTSVYTSTDGVTYTLAGNVSYPTTSLLVSAPSATQTLYVEARNLSGAKVGNFNTPLTLNGLVPAWAAQVVTNGGAQVSQSTLNALVPFVNTISASTLWSKLLHLNVIAPDSLIAAYTPLIKGSGFSKWGNANAGAGAVYAVDVNGLKNTTTAGALNAVVTTGIFPETALPALSSGNAGCTIVLSKNNSDLGLTQGCGPAWAGGNNNFLMMTNQGGNAYCAIFDVDSSAINPVSLPSNPTTGYFSFNRVTTTDHRCFFANSTHPHAQLGATVTAANTHNPPTSVVGFTLFGDADAGGQTPTQNKVWAFFALHQGLTLSESNTLASAVQALRTAFGGGWT